MAARRVSVKDDPSSPDKSSTRRISLYLETPIATELNQQVESDGPNVNSWANNLFHIIFLSPGGQKMREFASEAEKPYLELLRDLVSLLDKRVPIDRIAKLATSSQRNIIQMMIYLMILGLKSYESGNDEPLLTSEKEVPTKD